MDDDDDDEEDEENCFSIKEEDNDEDEEEEFDQCYFNARSEEKNQQLITSSINDDNNNNDKKKKRRSESSKCCCLCANPLQNKRYRSYFYQEEEEEATKTSRLRFADRFVFKTLQLKKNHTSSSLDDTTTNSLLSLELLSLSPSPFCADCCLKLDHLQSLYDQLKALGSKFKNLTTEFVEECFLSISSKSKTTNVKNHKKTQENCRDTNSRAEEPKNKQNKAKKQPRSIGDIANKYHKYDSESDPEYTPEVEVENNNVSDSDLSESDYQDHDDDDDADAAPSPLPLLLPHFSDNEPEFESPRNSSPPPAPPTGADAVKSITSMYCRVTLERLKSPPSTSTLSAPASKGIKLASTKSKITMLKPSSTSTTPLIKPTTSSNKSAEPRINSNTIVQCPHCPKTFKWASHLRLHARSHSSHKKQRPQCHVCPHSFCSKKNLNRHLFSVHNLSLGPKLKGPGIGAGAGSIYSVEEFELKCEICFKVFKRRDMLRTHVRDVHKYAVLKSLRCEHCKDRRFLFGSELKRHKVLVHGETEEEGAQGVKGADGDGEPGTEALFGPETEKLRQQILEGSKTCKDCGLTFDHVIQLRKHERNAFHGEAKCNQCEHCGKAFSVKPTLFKHIRLKHGGPGPTPRPLTLTTTQSDSSFQHFQDDNSSPSDADDQHDDAEVSGPCTEPCTSSSSSSSSCSAKPAVRRRQRTPTSPSSPSVVKPRRRRVRAFKLTCTYCPEVFKYSDKLNRHLVKSHPEKHLAANPHICNVCCRTFASQSQLNEHSASTHFKCSFEGCEKIERSQRLLQRHENCVHTGARPFICSFCGKSFKAAENCLTHEKLHGAANYQPREANGVKPRKNRAESHTCQYCSSEFHSRGRIHAHLAKIHPEKYLATKPHLCPVCYRNYETQELLEAHQAAAHFKCTILPNCPKLFHSKATLQVHELTHTTRLKAFVCLVCGKSYSNEAGLRHHEEKNHNHTITDTAAGAGAGLSTMYKCHDCELDLQSQELLETHMKEIHSDADAENKSLVQFMEF